MKTLQEIKNRAYDIAESHFFADVDERTAWEPFENYPDDWLESEIESMADMLIGQMLWAQK